MSAIIDDVLLLLLQSNQHIIGKIHEPLCKILACCTDARKNGIYVPRGGKDHSRVSLGVASPPLLDLRATQPWISATRCKRAQDYDILHDQLYSAMQGCIDGE